VARAEFERRLNQDVCLSKETPTRRLQLISKFNEVSGFSASHDDRRAGTFVLPIHDIDRVLGLP
jgi:hypothetical protein